MGLSCSGWRSLSVRIHCSCSFFGVSQAHAAYPVHRPPRKSPVPSDGVYEIHPDQPQQTVWGLGFEIQCDSIGSGNHGLPDDKTSVPHDLTQAERKRFAKEMLTGFRYCRLAGGLYWRATDPTGRFLQPRWPEQLEEVRQMMQDARVESLSLEYWSPPPFWKANRGYTNQDPGQNILRCFGEKFGSDPDYHGDVEGFLRDYADACITDIKTLEAAGFRVDQWGLSNEPWTSTPYSTCKFTKEEYGQVFKAVAPKVRRHDHAYQDHRGHDVGRAGVHRAGNENSVRQICRCAGGARHRG